MNLIELIERLQEAHAKFGNHPNVTVRFESAGQLDEEGGSNISGVEIVPPAQMIVIRG
jgi:hypothetical protein